MIKSWYCLFGLIRGGQSWQSSTEDLYSPASTGRGSNRHGASTSYSGYGNRRQDGSKSNSHYSTSSYSAYNNKDDDINSIQSREEIEDQYSQYENQGSQSWRGNNQLQSSNRKQNGGKSTSSWRQSTHYRSDRQEQRESLSRNNGGWTPLAVTDRCTGIRVSPFAVPGIDEWCANNCAKGYCPETHCVCT